MKTFRHAAIGLLAIGACAGFAACGTVPSLEGRTVSRAITQTDATRLGKSISPLVEARPGLSGIHLLAEGHDAFAARVLLANAAERSLDVQYYIWRHDLSGTLLFEALRNAAERGVRVRLLLDDNNTPGLDPVLAALDAHPNIEVRLFNPFFIRSPRAFGYLTDFSRLNRRMHNKSFTADNQATIIGGRNVGDEYFDATEGVVFVDLDVLAVGPVVDDVSKDFDRYWASGSSYPADRVLPPPDTAFAEQIASEASLVERYPRAAAYVNAVRNSALVRDLEMKRLPLEWATTRMVSDDPAKGLGLASTEMLLLEKLRAIIGEPAEIVDLVSPYFVPGETVSKSFAEMAARGVRIRILTNSLEATDVLPVHSGYAKWRVPLLEAGITLYELRRLSLRAKEKQDAGFRGSSGSSLHAKTFSVDRSRAFIGSFNFDPRSAKLNTEIGFVIDSPAIAQRIDNAFAHRIPGEAYEVRLTEAGRPFWIEQRVGSRMRHDSEPGAGLMQRAKLWFLSLLPIESLL